MVEKKQELEKRLQDVTGQLGSAKKASKKGKHHHDGKLIFISDQWIQLTSSQTLSMCMFHETQSLVYVFICS